MAHDSLVSIYRSAPAFLQACAPTLLNATRTASATLPLSSSFALRDGEIFPSPGDIWLAAPAENANRTGPPATIVLVLVGVFPGVLTASEDPSSLKAEGISQVMSAFVRALDDEAVSVGRIYSIIGPVLLSNAFASAWEATRGIRRRPKPFMHMYHTSLTPASIQPSARAPPPGTKIACLGSSDVEAATKMNQRFQATTPHRLDDAAALVQTQELILREQMFGAHVDGVLRSIAVMKGTIPGVRGLTKVWTDEAARGQGLAELVLREACERQVARRAVIYV
jgi:hypothetical protein